MKISLNNIGPFRREASGFAKSEVRTAGGLRTAGNYDAITIHSSSRQIQEKTFSEALSKQIVSEVKQGVSEERVQALKQQVQAGAYRVDPYAVASRMLLAGGAVYGGI